MEGAEEEQIPSITDLMTDLESCAALQHLEASCSSVEALVKQIAALGVPNAPAGMHPHLISAIPTNRYVIFETRRQACPIHWLGRGLTEYADHVVRLQTCGPHSNSSGALTPFL